MRPIPELYKALYEYVKDKDYFFICAEIHSMFRRNILNEYESNSLLTHFVNNKPTEETFPEIFNHPLYIGTVKSWFNMENSDKHKESSTLRKQYLQKLIGQYNN